MPQQWLNNLAFSATLNTSTTIFASSRLNREVPTHIFDCTTARTAPFQHLTYHHLLRMGKRKSAAAPSAARGGGGGSPAAASSKKDKRSVAAMLTAQAVQGPGKQLAERLELPAPPARQLSAELKHRIETDVERYKKKWSEWCAHQEQHRRRQSSSLAPGSAGSHHHVQEERMELDALALQLLDAIGRVQSHASGAALDAPTLEALVLVCRNDACHSHPNLSRQAYTLLMAQLSAHPVAQPGAGPDGAPCLLRNDAAAWVPLTSDLGSFTAKYLLLPDITVSGARKC